MKLTAHQDKSAGFALLEGLLVVVVLVAVVGVGLYIKRQKHPATASLTSVNTPQTQPTAPVGTSANIDQLTQLDGQTEANVYKSGDAQTEQNAAASSAAVNNVGGAYNEANL